jgi:FHS family L-fucose permease-like MFS transporter
MANTATPPLRPAVSKSALPTLISVFFFWGFVAASNDILIPVFKEALQLEQWQSQLISFAFYIAYTVGSIIYYFISRLSGGDILNRIGYKNGIALGLVISALGTLLFYPAAQAASFGLMISGLFIVGLGFSLQQTAANPLTIVLGDPSGGSQRLSLAGGINNIGTTIGPLLVSFAIFGSLSSGTTAVASIESVQTPYLVLGAAFVLVALIFKFSSIPDNIASLSGDQETGSPDAAARSGALKYPQLVLGMIAIFVYVGVEVSTASNLPEFMRQHLQVSTDRIAPFISLFWASLMIGRWTSAARAFNLSDSQKSLLGYLLPFLAFLFFIGVNLVAGHDIRPFYVYPALILVLILAERKSKGNPSRQLFIFSLLGIAALVTGMLGDGLVSVYAFISVGLFCSTLWPCIFTLAINGLGRHTNQGSGFLIMMIMGGGIVSLFQGFLAGDHLLGIQYSYVAGTACFAYLAFYAWKVRGIFKKQGLES